MNLCKTYRNENIYTKWIYFRFIQITKLARICSLFPPYKKYIYSMNRALKRTRCKSNEIETCAAFQEWKINYCEKYDESRKKNTQIFTYTIEWVEWYNQRAEITGRNCIYIPNGNSNSDGRYWCHVQYNTKYFPHLMDKTSTNTKWLNNRTVWCSLVGAVSFVHTRW